MLEFNAENNERYSVDYLVNRSMLITQRGHPLQGRVCKIIPYRHSGHTQVFMAEEGVEEGVLVNRTEFLSVQWVNKETFPEYYL